MLDRKNIISDLNNLVRIWMSTGGANPREGETAHPVQIRFVFDKKARGVLVPDWRFIFFHKDREVSAFLLAAIMCVSFNRQGLRYTQKNCLDHINSIAFEAFMEMEEPAWVLKRREERNTSVVPRGRGRPRKAKPQL